MSSEQLFDLLVVGGGAAGFMGAITAAEGGLSSVLILETNQNSLNKVRISGGGRCNVTNACWDPRDLVTNYPRGSVSLHSIFNRFSTGDTVEWFSQRGLELVVESDGRIFPFSNTSESVLECLREAAHKSGVQLRTKCLVSKIKHIEEKGFVVKCLDGFSFLAKRVLLATGAHPSGRRIASELSHTIIMPVPSLFSFTLDAPLLKECSGLSVDNVELNLKAHGETFHEIGRVLITHWGMSGPAILRMSAFAARDLNLDQYKTNLVVNWIGSRFDETLQILNNFSHENASRTLTAVRPFLHIPKRLWLALLLQVDINVISRWAELSKKHKRSLTNALVNSSYIIQGRGPFGEEFVTAGGVNLAEINLINMESRLCKGLYFAGEVLNIDGITGGFNFQHCWSSGWLAGKAIVHSFVKD